MNRMSSKAQMQRPHRRAVGVWAVLMVLLVLLGLAAYFAYQGLVVGEVDVPAQGYVAMVLGIGVSLGLGVGLMVLVFYSSRAGYDEPPRPLNERTDLDQPGAVSSKRESQP